MNDPERKSLNSSKYNCKEKIKSFLIHPAEEKSLGPDALLSNPEGKCVKIKLLCQEFQFAGNKLEIERYSNCKQKKLRNCHNNK